MASSVTLASRNEAFPASFIAHQCAYCRSSIAAGQRWVREKIQEPFATDDPRYHRYHADLFGEEELSCWEKHQMQQQTKKPA
jgi:hypothetical protein